MPVPETAREWFEYFTPHFSNAEDLRYVGEDEIETALDVALPWRPACGLLTDAQKDQAQAHYAAYVIEFRAKMAAASATTTIGTAVVAGPIVEKQEGDVRVKYATTGGVAASSSAIKAQLTGPGTSYAAWQALWEVCVPAVVEGDRPVRRGAIVTAYG
jgi:hypothetical protein